MTDDPTGGQPGNGTPTDQPGEGVSGAPAVTPEAGTAAPRTYTQEEFDRATTAARKKAEAEARSAGKERDELAAWRREREQADMTELDRVKAQLAEQVSVAQIAAADAADAKRRLVIEQTVRETNPTLPGEFLATITATDPEEIKTAVAAANERWTALLGQHAKPAPATPQSVGAPSNPQGQAPANLRGTKEIAAELHAISQNPYLLRDDPKLQERLLAEYATAKARDTQSPG